MCMMEENFMSTLDNDIQATLDRLFPELSQKEKIQFLNTRTYFPIVPKETVIRHLELLATHEKDA